MNNNLYLKRCYEIAKLGHGSASPNPRVGAVIVHNNRIIGEGYHQKYGNAHAEVNAVKSVKDEDRHLLSASTIYISLEPCCIHGNTPPCTELIIKHKIPKVVYEVTDPTEGVNGKSKAILEAAGVEVVLLETSNEGKNLSKNRSVFTTQNRPFVILKYAVSQDGFIGKADQQIWLSNAISKRLSHRWRNETDAILVGSNTAKLDNPALTNRLYFGKNPLRIVLDRKLQLDRKLKLFDNKAKTWIITEKQHADQDNIYYKTIAFDDQLIPKILYQLHKEGCSWLVVEGGAQTIQHFIEKNYWDEARIFKTKKQLITGITSPKHDGILQQKIPILDDELQLYANPNKH